MSHMVFIAAIVIYVIFLMVMTEISRRSIIFGFIVNIGLFILLFFSTNIDGWFRWAKSLSVLIPMIVVHLGRLSSKKQNNSKLAIFLRGPYVLGFLAGILSLNILEASLKGIQLGNLANGVCGLIMIACIPFALKKAWRFDNKDRDVLVSDLTLTWCLIYTTWNACFVFGESPAYFASSCCILFVPEIYNFISVKRKKSNLWLHARIYTLMLHVSIRSFYDVFTPFMNSENFYNEQVWKVWGMVNFILMALYAVWWFRKTFAERTSDLQRA